MTTKTIHTNKIEINDESVSKKSRETIGKIIDTSTKQLKNAVEKNKHFVQSIEKQIFNGELKDNYMVSDVNRTFRDSVEISEKAIDSIIDMQAEQLQSTIDFNKKLTESLKNLYYTDKEAITDMIGLLRQNYEEATDRLIENTKKMSEIYNQHVNLAINFNERFSGNINHQLQILNRYTSKTADLISEWPYQWWKPTPIEHFDLDRE